MKELPEKYKRLNKRLFKEAKKEFDDRFGDLFSYERKTPYDDELRYADETVADKIERELESLIARYEERSFHLGDVMWLGKDEIAKFVVIFETIVCEYYFPPKDDDECDELCSDVIGCDTEETIQGNRIHELIIKLIRAGAKIALEIKSDTYPGWRDLLVYICGYRAWWSQHQEGDEEIRECGSRIWVISKLHQRLWADLQIMGKANAPKRELGEWAKRFVADYDVKHGYVELLRGQQHSFRIPETSAKAWDILMRLFTANDAEGWAKLPPNWKSHFIRKIGSTGEIDRESDLVRIAAFIRPHTPGKGRASDGKYRFEPIRRVRENLK